MIKTESDAMKDKLKDNQKSEDRSFELLVKKLKENLLVEGTRKTGVEDISEIIGPGYSPGAYLNSGQPGIFLIFLPFLLVQYLFSQAEIFRSNFQ